MIQQNRFCGIILKNQSLRQRLPAEFEAYTEQVYVDSQFREVFDGFREGDFGGWSSAIFSEKDLVLSRDRVGVRSMYYIDHEEYFCFSNTLLHFKSLPFITLRPNPKGVFQFFFNGSTTDMIVGVQELAPGSELVFDLTTLTYSISQPEIAGNRETKVGEEESAVQTRNHLNETISKVLEATDHVAGFLSGGIDSSVIACGVKEMGANIPFLTAYSGVEGMDEVTFAGDVASSLNLKQWEKVEVGDVGKDLENLHRAMELPTTSMGSFMQYELMRYCSENGIQHVLDGTGADALYAGHNYYHAIYWNMLIRQGKFRKLIKETQHFVMDIQWIKFYVKSIMKYYYVPRFTKGAKMKFHLRNNPLYSGLNGHFIATQSGVLSAKPTWNLKNLNVYLAKEFYGGSVTELLRFTDRIGKAFGVMSHPVFAINPELYENALSIPASDKIQKGITKKVLRNAYSDMLPASVLERRDKMGLKAPNNEWMRENKEVLMSYITKDLSEFFDVDHMRKLLSEAVDHSGPIENYKIFRFFSFAIWYKVIKE